MLSWGHAVLSWGICGVELGGHAVLNWGTRCVELGDMRY